MEKWKSNLLTFSIIIISTLFLFGCSSLKQDSKWLNKQITVDGESGEEIEIKPGLRVKEDYVPIKTKIISISQGNNFLEVAKPGGLIGLGTNLDPALTKGDHLIGHLVGKPGTLPEVLNEIDPSSLAL